MQKRSKLRSTVPVSIPNISLVKGLLASKFEMFRKEVIPYQWKALNDEISDADPSHSVENFRIAAGLKEGEYYGRTFQDSDVYKWLEGVSYCLAQERDEALEKIADEVIDLIAQAQQEDGYLDTFISVTEPPENRWTNVRDRHELYVAGHLIEAAVAYYESTGKRNLLNVAIKLADHIDDTFGPDPGKKRGYPGHQEVELALVRLYRATNDKKYLKLSQYFIDERGRRPHYFEKEAKLRNADPKHYDGLYDYSYSQSHLPVREQTVAVGHSVRAVYMYTAMADLALETGDQELAAACERLWENVTQKQMYITAGIGSHHDGEEFTFDYDLPNDLAYTETCASIGLVFWAAKMQQLDPKGDYADVIERALYNGILSGISLDGNKYFYVNPLEVWPPACGRRIDKRHVKFERQPWFGCACCPPNVTRLYCGVGQYFYGLGGDNLYVHQYAGSEAKIEIDGEEIIVQQNTNYPWDGKIEISLDLDKEQEFAVSLRIPGWCRRAGLSVNGETLPLDEITQDGYAQVLRTWAAGDKILLDLAMPVERIQANPQVRGNNGKVALQRGPLVYCLEEVDNGPILTDIVLPPKVQFSTQFESDLLNGIVTITAEAFRSKDWNNQLYRPFVAERRPVQIKAVPYFAWSNRTPGEMIVWVRQG